MGVDAPEVLGARVVEVEVEEGTETQVRDTCDVERTGLGARGTRDDLLGVCT